MEPSRSHVKKQTDSTCYHACLATLRHSAVLPPYVGVGGVTPGPVADSSGVPAVVVWVLQLWNHIHRQAVLVGKLQDKTKEKQQNVKHRWKLCSIEPATRGTLLCKVGSTSGQCVQRCLWVFCSVADPMLSREETDLSWGISKFWSIHFFLYLFPWMFKSCCRHIWVDSFHFSRKCLHKKTTKKSLSSHLTHFLFRV